MQDVFLSLHVVEGGPAPGGLLAFLVLAPDEIEAASVADEFVEHVEVLAADASDFYSAAMARDAINAMRPRVCFVREPSEMRLLSQALARTNPKLASALIDHLGEVFTVRVAPESGFPVETADVLRKRMAKHHVLSTLTVPLA